MIGFSVAIFQNISSYGPMESFTLPNPLGPYVAKNSESLFPVSLSYDAVESSNYKMHYTPKSQSSDEDVDLSYMSWR